MAIMAGATALSAWLMEPVVNDVFIRKDQTMLWLVGGAVLLTFVVKGIANYAQATLMSHVGLKIIADNQNRLYAHLAHMDLAFFKTTRRANCCHALPSTSMRCVPPCPTFSPALAKIYCHLSVWLP